MVKITEEERIKQLAEAEEAKVKELYEEEKEHREGEC